MWLIHYYFLTPWSIQKKQKTNIKLPYANYFFLIELNLNIRYNISFDSFHSQSADLGDTQKTSLPDSVRTTVVQSSTAR